MKISVVIPCYNLECYVRECLDSVNAAMMSLKGTVVGCGVDVEVILVDDGSTDGTGMILDEYVRLNTMFKVFHKGNGGEGSARNAGIELASGDWLMFFDGDDIVAPTTFVDVVNASEKFPNADLIRFGTLAYNDGAKVDWMTNVDAGIAFIDCRSELQNELAMFGVTEMAYHRDKFGAFRFRDYCIGADLVFTSKCFAVANEIAVIDRKNYGYRIRQGSAAHSDVTPRKLRDMICYHREMFENLVSSGKRLGRSFWRGRGNGWIEMCGAELVAHKNDAAWCAAWQQWLESLSVASKMQIFSLWQKFVIRAIVVTRSKWMVSLLCAFPANLKRKGLHR